MSKHTPGPWHWQNGRLEAVTPAWEARIACILNDDGCTVYRETYGAGVDAKTEQDANLQLIAAAPDLLKALKDVVRIADRKTVEFDAAREAIAKAEGQQS